MRLSAAVALVSIALSAPATAAARSSSLQAAVISPWVALSALGSSASSSALCAASTAAAAVTAAQGAAPGCVFPQVDAAVAPAVSESPVVPAAPPVAAAGGIGALPILLGLAGAAVVAALLLSGGGGDDDVDIRPPTTVL